MSGRWVGAMGGRFTGAAAGLLVDRLLGEPPQSLHPVARFGDLMTRLEAELYADRRASGAVYALAGSAVGFTAGGTVQSTTAAVALCSSGRMLRSTARDVARSLDRGDMVAARAALPALVGRDVTHLDASGIAAAVIESVAENTVDAVVAPALWGAALGAPGAALHRAVNTMDAMVGHHSPRYEHFGSPAARLDDAAAYLPARTTAVLVALCRIGRAKTVVRTVRRDARAHPSPNAGVAEAAFAAALGVELCGTLRYGDRVEYRPRLGTGPRPCPADIDEAVQLADRVELLLTAILFAFGVASIAVSGRSAARARA